VKIPEVITPQQQLLRYSNWILDTETRLNTTPTTAYIKIPFHLAADQNTFRLRSNQTIPQTPQTQTEPTSSKMSTSKPTIFFLGATGGCTLAALTHTLNAGYPSIALARTPSKLTQLLLSAGIPQTTLNQLLKIHPGNALSTTDVKTALLLASPSQSQSSSPTLPSTIITGLGATPQFNFRSLNPLNWVTIDNATLCGTAAATLVSALREIYTEYPDLLQKKPLLAFISTTGISNVTEDVPFWMRFLYHQILAVPHRDKRVMESVFRGSAATEGNENGVFRAVIGVRPTLLTSAEPRGIEGVRVGREERPEMGYTVSRGDVGEWVFKVVIEGEGRGWEGECASLTN
jgi:hypothetical protein